MFSEFPTDKDTVELYRPESISLLLNNEDNSKSDVDDDFEDDLQQSFWNKIEFGHVKRFAFLFQNQWAYNLFSVRWFK